MPKFQKPVTKDLWMPWSISCLSNPCSRKSRPSAQADEELEQNNFVVPAEPHLAIAFLYNEAGEIKSCTMVYAEDATRGVKHFY